MKFIIDAGHGPDTPGKRSPDGRLREFQFNASVAAEIKQRLTAEGHTVIFTHQQDKDVSLIERVRLANRLKGDAFISVHANAYGTGFNSANGVETYIFTRSLASSRLLAKLIHQPLILASGRKDRGVKKADFFVLRETAMPAILVECGFMTHKEEAKLLQTKKYQINCARAIAFGAASFADSLL